MTIPTFPALTGLSWPVVKTPTFFSRFKHRSVSGKSTMQNPQPFAVYAYALAFDVLRSDAVNHELQTLMSFYQFCVGQSSPFHFNDPDDTTVTGQGLGSGDGATTDFAFVRAMGTVVDLVQDVIAAGLVVYVNGVAKTIVSDYSILTTSQYSTNYAVRFVSAPAAAAVITADFSYNWLCEFPDDSEDFAKFMNQLWEMKAIKFNSILQ